MKPFLQQEAVDETTLPWLEDAQKLGEQPAADWVRALRHTGAEAFSHAGFPQPGREGWQYTSLRPLTQARFHYAPEPVKFDVKVLPPQLLQDSARIVLVNGQYQPDLSAAPQGVTVMSLMDASVQIEGLEEHLVTVGDLAAAPFKALNAAYMHDGAVVAVKDDADIAQPLEVLFYNIGSAAESPAIHPRCLYWLGKNSGLTVIERHAGMGAYFTNIYTGIALEPAARLKLYKLEEESAAACHFSYTALQQQKDSSFEGFNYAAGGKLVRQEYQNLLIDSGISCRVSGVYLLKDQQCHDFTVLTDHFEPDGKSVQHFKGVVDDQARSVFQGKIHVRRAAQKTDGNQLNHALLLSEKAEASFKPELEIYADDVKCSHGAASGQLDDDALFYLQSRGIPLAQAKSLLIESFLNAALAEVSFAPAREVYEERIRAWLRH
ncbi:MAG: Fe-S cluster assembly protein SufD [Alphaproteobacteria bacterium]|nr:Fe-S cluster assembly protein SufD [Alphaproteobacteria bacterium]